MTIRHILGAEALLGLAQMVVLTLLYGLRSRWYSSLAGWVLLSSFLTKLVIFGLIALGMFRGPLGPYVWAGAVLAFDLVQMGWIVLLIRQLRTKHRPDTPDHL